jgi:hypothetical protein
MKYEIYLQNTSLSTSNYLFVVLESLFLNEHLTIYCHLYLFLEHFTKKYFKHLKINRNKLQNNNYLDY